MTPMKMNNSVPVNRAELLEKKHATMQEDPMFALGMSAPRAVALQASTPLREVIDVEQLVNTPELREHGIDPGAVRILVGPDIRGSYSGPAYHFIVLSEHDLDWPDEYVYMVLAHELTHHMQLLGMAVSDEEMEADQRVLVHGDRRFEKEAIETETEQAVKFGWSDEDYYRYLLRLYPESLELPKELTRDQRRRITREWIAVEQAKMDAEREKRMRLARPVLERGRNVSVRRHARRKS